MSLFRGGNDDAFRVIHDRYRQRLHAYSRQMLAGSVADAEDVVQEIFVRAYGGLRSSDRELALRAWLYRIAHNRCIDEVRRPQPIATEAIEELTAASAPDPATRIEQRDALRRLIADVRRLPEQQRSALLMRELGGMPYADVANALAVSVPAVKSLLVRARVGLAQAGEARDTSCTRIREDLMVSHDRGVRTSGLARRHMRDCPDCRRFRSEVRGVSRHFAAMLPVLGPIGLVAKLLGVGSAGGGGAAAGTGAVASTGAAAGGTGAVISVGAVTAGAGHVVTLIAAAVVTAGGAIELQRISPPTVTHVGHRHVVRAAPVSTKRPASPAQVAVSAAAATPAESGDSASTPAGTAATAPARGPQMTASALSSSSSSSSTSTPTTADTRRHPLPISEVVDPDNLNSDPAAGNPTTATTPSTITTPAATTPGAPIPTGTTTTGLPTTTSPTSPTGTTPTGTSTVPITGTIPSAPPSSTGSTDGSGTTQSPTALTPLTQTSKTSGTGSGSKGGVALGATGASTRPGSVRVYKSTHR